MDPNANGQPQLNGQPPTQQPEQPQEQWPPQEGPKPDWQQGLGMPAALPQQPATPQAQVPTSSFPSSTSNMSPVTPGVGDQQMPTAMPGMPPQQSGPVMGMGSPAKKLRLGVFVLIGAAVLLILLITSYFLFFNKKNTANNAAQTSTNSSVSKNAIDMSTLASVTLNTPSDLSVFQADSATGSYYHMYVTKNSVGTNACSLIFGSFTSAQLPGTDLNSIVAQGLDALRKAGATITGPSAGSALILKDAVSSGTTYSMPTITYQFSEGVKHASERYSIVILKNGNRLAVTRQCANANGNVDQATLNTVENAAEQITVTKS
jgi:hypothetical protein